jgi:hypothetical protein
MEAQVQAFTSITTNYLPKARVLAHSIKRLAPAIRFHLVLNDHPPPGFALADEPFDSLIGLDELGFGQDRQWLFGHTLVELCTAVKGRAFQYLFDRCGAAKAFYFDPDTVVFGRLEELCALLDRHAAILTPHQCAPEETLEAVMDNELASLRHGVFNLGFLGVRGDGEGRRLVDWWTERLRLFCHDDFSRGLFTDQRWMDLAPCFFPGVGIVRDPGFNVATWNLTHRQVTGSLREGIRVNGEPLGFYHFSGFDSGAQELMLNKYGADNPALLELRQWYLGECDRHGQAELGRRVARWSQFDDGTPIEPRQREVYRIRTDLQRAFPDPFATADPNASYLHWWRANAPSDAAAGSFRAPPDAPFGRVLGEFIDYTAARVRRTPRLGRWGRAGLLAPLALARRLARLLPG